MKYLIVSLLSGLLIFNAPSSAFAESVITCGSGEHASIGCTTTNVESSKIVEQRVEHVVVNTSAPIENYFYSMVILGGLGTLSLIAYKLTRKVYIFG